MVDHFLVPNLSTKTLICSSSACVHLRTVLLFFLTLAAPSRGTVMGVLGESASELSRELVDGVAKLRLSSLVLAGERLWPENLLFLEGDVKADLDGWFFVVPGVDTDLEFVPPGVMGAGFFPFMENRVFHDLNCYGFSCG